jgi:hypothetical protein
MYIERKVHMKKWSDRCTSVTLTDAHRACPMHIGQNGIVIRHFGRCTSVAFFLAKITVTDAHRSRPIYKSGTPDATSVASDVLPTWPMCIGHGRCCIGRVADAHQALTDAWRHFGRCIGQIERFIGHRPMYRSRPMNIGRDRCPGRVFYASVKMSRPVFFDAHRSF